MSSPRTLLLTGFPGWFGASFVEKILTGAFSDITSQEYRIVAFVEPARLSEAQTFIDHLSHPLKTSSIELIPLDLSDASACAKIQRPFENASLVHAAGIIHPKSVKDFAKINVDGTRHIFDLAYRCGVQQAILVSSNSPCGANPTPTHRFTPSSPYVPYMGYGKSKMQGELVATHWSSVHNIPLTILRPCWFFGPHQPARQARFFEMILAGRAPLVAHGTYLRSITFVDDLCQSVVRALERPGVGTRTYWVALEEPASFQTIVETIRDVMQTDFRLEPKEKHLTLPGAAASVARVVDASLQSLGGYHQEMHVLGELGLHITCSIEATKRDLGFQPTATLRDVVVRSLGWALEHTQLKRP